MNSTFPELTARLSASLGARPVADVTLEYVIQRHGAAGGAVLSLRAGAETVPFITRDVPTARLALAQKLLVENAALLSAGQDVPGPDCLVVPLPDGAARLVGLLFLDAPKVVSGAAMMDTFVTVFANCLVARAADPSPALASYLGTLTPTDEAREREALILALNRHEWNISRVSRDLGVTRRTIYLRLQKHRIERRRIPKVAPPRGEPGPA